MALQENALLPGFLFQSGPGRGSVLLSLCFWKKQAFGKSWDVDAKLGGSGAHRWGWLQDQGLHPALFLQ